MARQRGPVLVAGLLAIIALAGADAARPERWHAGGDRPRPADDRAGGAAAGRLLGAELAPAGVGRLAGRPAGQGQPLGREVIGTMEPVSRRLHYGLAGRQVTLRYPGAKYVKVHFSRVDLLPGDSVTVSSPDGTESYPVGPGWATSIIGDTVVVRLHAPMHLLPPSRPGVDIDRVARGFTEVEWQHRPRPRTTESVCGRDDKADVACYASAYPVEYTHTRPVARMLIDGVAMCTAWRVGPNNRLLTNSHCVRTPAEVAGSELWFNYQCVACGGRDIARTVKVTGARLLRSSRVLDFTLFSVQGFELIRGFGFLELDARRPGRGEDVYIPQHPGGGPKQLAISSDKSLRGACEVDEPEYDGYDAATDVAYRCDTDGGSSGSPVISRLTHRVVALHHFGGCPNSGIRGDLVYREVASLL